MKRSELIEIIAKAVHPCNSTIMSMRTATAIRILNVIEELGTEVEWEDEDE